MKLSSFTELEESRIKPISVGSLNVKQSGGGGARIKDKMSDKLAYFPFFQS